MAAKHDRELRKLETKFKTWRRTRARGSRIPAELWKEAASLAKSHGLWKVSKRLTLDYYGLKKRCTATARKSKEQRSRKGSQTRKASKKVSAASATQAAAFFELPLLTKAEPECLLEFEDARGVRLRIGLRRSAVEQLEKAARVLWDLNR